MTDTAEPVAEAPAPVTPAPAKPDAREELLRELVTAMRSSMTVQETLAKEYTHAMVELTKAMRAVQYAVLGTAPTREEPEGTDGLMDAFAGVQESLDDLDGRMTGMNLILARYSWVFDRMLDIQNGDPEAKDPDPGKNPEAGTVCKTGRPANFRDMVAALHEFDKRAEEEAVAELEEEKKEQEEEDRKKKGPGKLSMMTNKPPPPTMRALPPLPVAPPKPAAPVGAKP